MLVKLCLLLIGIASASAQPPVASTPIASPHGMMFTGSLSVTLASMDAGAKILYTTDGTNPDTTVGGATKAYGGPISITATTSIRAIAVKNGYAPSAVMTDIYTYVQPPKVARPTASPSGREFANPIAVSLSTATVGASILYTLDGSTPSAAATASTKQYTGLITITTTSTIKAIAIRDGFFSSDVMVETYTFVPTASAKNGGLRGSDDRSSGRESRLQAPQSIACYDLHGSLLGMASQSPVTREWVLPAKGKSMVLVYRMTDGTRRRYLLQP